MSKNIMHVFQEEKPKGMRDHMKYWFGRNVAEDFDIVCHCGAKLVTVGFDEDSNEISACWHFKEYKGVTNE